MAEIPRSESTAWELAEDGEVIETQVFPDGSRTHVRPHDLGDPNGPAYDSGDTMRLLGFSEDIVQMYEQRWEHFRNQE
jgi:hypothetical protein